MELQKKVISRMRLARLILCERMGVLSESDRAYLAAWLEADEHNQKLYTTLSRTIFPFRMVSEKEKEMAWESFNNRYGLKPGVKKIRKNSYWMAAAAVAVLLMVAGGFYFFPEKKQPEEILVPDRNNSIQLVLEGGNTIILDPEKPGDEFEIKSARVLSGEKIVDYSKGDAGGENLYHKLIVPKYGEYSVLLEDQTRIRINSGGSLRYPVRFSKEKREVWLEGEAYFDVAKSAGKEFIIHALGVEIKVLGTSFNVETNRAEKTVKATLVEGAIEVWCEQEHRQILPGQQLEVSLNDTSFNITDVDVNVATAWLRDRFYFEEKTLETIMKTLGDWYDFNVEFMDDKLKQQKFTVEISRFEQMDNILELLEETRMVSFEKRGRKIIVI